MGYSKGMTRKQRTPLAMSDDMLTALQEGRLRLTVRALNERDYSFWHDEDEDGWPIYEDDFGEWYRASPPYGPPGSFLWVRESYKVSDDGTVEYRHEVDPERETPNIEWAPVVGMPEACSRYRLRITRYEFRAGVQELTDAEIAKCGFDDRETFRKYWNKRYREHYQKWEQNPAVWITRFKLQVRKS